MASSKVGSIGEYIREQRTRAKISLRQLADVSGISNPYLSQIERGLRKPSAEILQQIAKGLRISAEALYVQAGILEDREADTDVQAAVRADLMLTERQKQVLLDIYASFLKENEAADRPSGHVDETEAETETEAEAEEAREPGEAAEAGKAPAGGPRKAPPGKPEARQGAPDDEGPHRQAPAKGPRTGKEEVG
jgi:transcriptional regulator with XRE-family HTH domain